MIVSLKNPDGHIRNAKIGFSWTTLFFGFFVPVCRSDVKWVIIMLLSGLMTMGLVFFIFAFTYNRTYIRGLLSEGYQPSDDYSRDALRRKGFIA